MTDLRIVLTFSVFVGFTYAATLPLNLQHIPEQLKGEAELSGDEECLSDVIPEAVTKFYNELTDDDKKILKEIAANHAKYENEDQALDALKVKSEKLHAKATELRQLLKTKIDSLQPAAKTFVESIIEKLRALKPKGDAKPDLKKVRGVATEVITAYTALNEEAKANLQETFPNITKVIKNDKFQQVAKGLIKTAN